MYLPKIYEETRLDVLHDLIRAHALGTWVSANETELDVHHIPFVLDPSRGAFGTLVGHVARANPVWKAAATKLPSAIIFRGPQAYITPSWYPSKHEHGKAVPTWNYAVVTVHGRAEFIDDRAWLYSHLAELTDTHEASQALPWTIDDAPRAFTDKLVAAIVGVEIPIQRIEGKWKTNQNRLDSDKMGVVAGLLEKGDAASVAMATLVRSHSKI
ncbi:MAG TPA: FMN-binding negative transcriptional regulator [Sphingobium sp.]|nr:FMN-binding negative transcriptional regulator [Sphingobium sp.]